MINISALAEHVGKQEREVKFKCLNTGRYSLGGGTWPKKFPNQKLPKGGLRTKFFIFDSEFDFEQTSGIIL
jgi:hypothetical protein